MSRTQDVVFRDIIQETADEMNLGYNVHNHLKGLSVTELRQIQDEDALPFQVMFFNLTGDMNIGSMIRTATLSGAQKVWVYGRRKFDRRGLVGANNYIDIERVNGFEGDGLDFSIEALNQILTQNKLVPIYAEHGGETLGQVNWLYNVMAMINQGYTPCIIMGNENSGFPPEIINYFKNYERSFCVSIPQRGVLRSFNVGHAFSMVVWDMRRSMGWE